MRKFFLFILAAVTAYTTARGDKAFLKKLQEELAKRGNPWVAGETGIPDEFIERAKEVGHTGYIRPKNWKYKIKESPLARARRLKGIKPPTTMDWRNYNGHNWMTPAKAQGSCGSCWAFAAVGAIEARLKIMDNLPHFNPNFSEQFLVSCCSEDDYTNGCCGGRMGGVYSYIRSYGVPDEACFPYQDWRTESCTQETNYPCSERCSDWGGRVVRVASYGNITVDQLKDEIMNGPVAIAVSWPDDEGKRKGIREDFFYYKSGVYTPIMGEWIPEPHAVLACGWDAEGNWLVKNSWGRQWGEGGFGYIDHPFLDPPATWAIPRPMTVPLIVLDSVRLSYANDEVWDPGEEISIVVVIEDWGIDVTGVQGVLRTTDPNVTIIDSAYNFGDISYGGKARNSSSPFKVRANTGVSTPHIVLFDLHVTAQENSYTRDIPFEITIGFRSCEELKEIMSPNEFRFPYGMAFDGTYLYVTNWYDTVIHKLTLDGTIVSTFSAPHKDTMTTGITYDPDHNCLWVHVYHREYRNIYQMNPSDGSVMTRFPTPADSYPTGIAYGRGYLWVVDRDKNKIYQMTTTGAPTGHVIDLPEVSFGPRGLAFDPQGGDSGTLILLTTYWDTTQSPPKIDSTTIDEITLEGNLVPEHRCRLNIINPRFVEVHPGRGRYWVGGGAADIHIIRGFYRGVGVEEEIIQPKIVNFTILPNPFREKVGINLHMSKAQKVDINIYDISGRLVYCLAADKLFNSGNHKLMWESINLMNQKVASGIYFCKVKAGEFTEVKKFILLR